MLLKPINTFGNKHVDVHYARADTLLKIFFSNY